MITARKPGESRSDFFKREFNLCMARVDKYYVLQTLRRDQGYFGAALFYQHEAARWHDRAMQSRRNWVVSGTRILSWQVTAMVQPTFKRTPANSIVIMDRRIGELRKEISATVALSKKFGLT